jgi:hypothetical protein
MVLSMSSTVAPLFAASQHPSEITAHKQRPYLWTSQSHDLGNTDPALATISPTLSEVSPAVPIIYGITPRVSAHSRGSIKEQRDRRHE